MIKLKPLLEQLQLDVTLVQRIAQSMGETLGERLGKGANGVAYATTSGRVLKITPDDYEVALATRLRTKRLYKHIINVQDVRRLGASDYYAILMDRVTPLNRTEAVTWNWISQRFLDRRTSDEEFRSGQTIAMMPTQTRQGEPLSPEFVQRCLAQRSGILRDFSELRINPQEAHAGNMGWNRHGNLVHFDAWQMRHYTQVDPDTWARLRANNYLAPLNRNIYKRGLGPDVDVEFDDIE